jgi:hypothetical protein
VPEAFSVKRRLSVTLTANSPCSRLADEGTAEAVELFLVMILVVMEFSNSFAEKVKLHSRLRLCSSCLD